MRLLLLLLLVTVCSKAQNITTASDSIQLSADCFWGVDAYTNVYYSANNTLVKQTAKKDFVYQNVLLSDITSTDITNPLSITLFYKKNNTAVILDNNLNQIKAINFNNLTDFKSISFATTAANQQLWIFDNQLQQLELFNYNTNTTLNIGQPIAENVIDMKSNYNFCWLLTTNYIYKFNSYGSLLYKVSFMEGKALTVDPTGNILIEKQNSLYRLDNQNHLVAYTDVNKFFMKDFFLAGDYLYIYDGKNFLKKYPFLKKN